MSDRDNLHCVISDLADQVRDRDAIIKRLRVAWAGVEWWLDEGMQEHMLEHGLIEEYDAPADAACACDEYDPHRCYRRTPLLTGEQG